MRDKVKRNFVCVKIIKIKNIPKKEREATRVEVDLLRRLNHPNIVRYIDSFLSKNGESLCICMEYCDGVSSIVYSNRYGTLCSLNAVPQILLPTG
jgi:NIMA (never in mitosis gene a)-related kinase